MQSRQILDIRGTQRQDAHEKTSGDLQKVAGDELDDVAAMVRYAMLTWFETSSKPREVAIQHRLEEYRANGMDDYSLNIYRFRMEREERQHLRTMRQSTAVSF